MNKRLEWWPRLKPNWKTAAIILMVSLPFNLFLFPARHAFLTRVSGRENVIIDVWFAYTPQQVYGVLPALGQQGRILYTATELTIDVLYPILYSALMWQLMAIFFSRLLPADSRLHLLKRLPAFVFSMDILENCGVSVLLLTYPSQLDWLAWMTSGFTSLKFILGALVLGIIACAGLLLAGQKIREWAKKCMPPIR